MIRKAEVNDSERIAEIEVASCRYAYKGIVSDEYLYNDLSVEKRIPVCKRWIDEKLFGVYVYEDDSSGVIKGMMGIGMCEDADKKDAFELHFLYVDPDHVRAGIGSEMLQFFEKAAKEKGCKDLVIWVLEENGMGRKFYEKNGYRSDGNEKIFMRWNKREIRYENCFGLSGNTVDK